MSTSPTDPPVDRRTRDEAVVARYRDSGGIPEADAPQLIVLHTLGAVTGRVHLKPVCVIEDGPDLVVAATMGGNPTHPQWYTNVVVNCRFDVEYRGETFEVEAETEPNGRTRDRLFVAMDEVIPGIDGYQDRCRDSRQIPIVRLRRTSPSSEDR